MPAATACREPRARNSRNLRTGEQPARGAKGEHLDDAGDDWIGELARAVADAPAWMRALASRELHIGGFTQAELPYPVLDAAGAPDDAAAERLLLFFVAASALDGAAIARVQCGRGARGGALARTSRRALRGVVARVDDENLALMRYFDLHLVEPAKIAAASGRRFARSVANAVRDPSG